MEMMKMKLVETIKDTLVERRAAHAARQQLVRELATYSSPSDMLELDTIIARYPEEETAELRDILTRQQMIRLAA